MTVIDQPWEHMTLEEIRAWLDERVAEGVHCPACNQYARVYRRKLTSATGRALCLMWRHAGTNHVHMPTLLGRKQADETKARYWGLIEELQERRDDGGRVGWWKLTDLGVRFVHGQARVPTYARIYDGELLELEPDPTVSMTDVLGTRFNYNDLMEGV